MNARKFVVFFCLSAIVGCANPRTETPKPGQQMEPAETPKAETPSTSPVAGLEDGWELAPGGAEFSATQKDGQVIIAAVGEHPASNYEAKLVQSGRMVWPPEYLLARKQTGDVGAAVMTPFAVTASFNADEPLEHIIITDAAGQHEVPVETQPPP